MKPKSRFWEYSFVFLFFACCWMWLAFAIPSLVEFKEHVSAFIMGPQLIPGYLAKPAFLSVLAGDFLTQFFYCHKYAGPTVMTLLYVILWLGLARVFTFCGAGKAAIHTALLPVVVEMYLVNHVNYPVSATVAFVLAAWTAAICMRANREGLRLTLFLTFLVLSYPLLCGGHTITLMLLFGLFYRRRPVIMVVGAIVTLLAMTLCGRLFGLPPLGTVMYPVIPGYKLPASSFFILLPLSVLAAGLCSLVFRSWMGILATTLAFFTSLYTGYNYIVEYMVTMNIHAGRRNWDKVWQMAVEAPEDSFFGYFYRDLCLARQGQLPDRLLYYPQLPEGGMNVPVAQGMDYLWYFASVDQLMEVGDISQATGCALLCQTVMPGGRSTHMMRRLAELAMIAGDFDVARKYLGMLSHNLVHRKWAGQMLEFLEKGELPEELQYYRRIGSAVDHIFLQSDWEGSLISLVATNPLNKTALDYLLCSYLLAKKTSSFVSFYDHYYHGRYDLDGPVPRLYQEALLSTTTSRASFLNIIARYSIDPAISSQYDKFLDAFGNSGGIVSKLSEFKGTYWHYMVSHNFSSLNSTKPK